MILIYGILFGILCIILFLTLFKTFKNIAKAAFGVFTIVIILVGLFTAYIFYDFNQLNNALEESPAFIVTVNDEIVTTAILPDSQLEVTEVQTLNAESIDFEAEDQERLIFAFDISYFEDNHTLILDEYDSVVEDFEPLFTAQTYEELAIVLTETSPDLDPADLEEALEAGEYDLESLKASILLQTLIENQGEAGLMFDIVEGLRADTIEVNNNYLTIDLLSNVPESFIKQAIEQTLE